MITVISSHYFYLIMITFVHSYKGMNFYLLRTFCPHLGSFLCCFFFHYVSAKFHLWPSSGDLPTVPGEHCQKIVVSNPTQAGQRFTWSKTWCDRQQLWKAVITGDTVTRFSIPIEVAVNHLKKARGEIWPKRSESRNNTKNYQDEDKKSAINKN